jgi:phospholipid/cholesterol/gamma-HCH transport system ATP-binding protein
VSDSINRLILRLQRQLSVTSIVVTHDLTSCNRIADRVALLNEGRRHFYGTLDDLRATEDPVVRDFVDGHSDDGED